MKPASKLKLFFKLSQISLIFVLAFSPLYLLNTQKVEASLDTSASWSVEGNQNSAYLGLSATTAGDVNGDGYSDVIAGAYSYDNGQNNEGRAFLYYGSATGPSIAADWTYECNQITAYCGYSVASAGDINGDGYADVIVGAQSYTNGETDEGVVFVFYGSSTGLAASPDVTLESNQASSYFGESVAGAGDVNGDGYSDIIVGAWYYDNGEVNEGVAFVYFGSASGISTTPDWIGESNQASAYYGRHVAGAGDVNNDGYADIIVGAYNYNNGQSGEGMAFIYLGSSTGPSLTPDWSVESNQTFANMGSQVAGAGDVNSDGYADVLVAALNYDNGNTDEGRAYLYLGTSTVPSTTPDWTFEMNQDGLFDGANIGLAVATAGDVNSDGYADILVGFERYDNGQADEGVAYMFYGSSSGPSLTPDWSSESDVAGAFYGAEVSPAGDTNGDGFGDILVGSWFYTNGNSNEGALFLYNGQSEGLDTNATWSTESNQASAYYGYHLTDAGDVNADGYGDVVVAAHLYDNGQVNEGAIWGYYGSNTGLSSSADWYVESDNASSYYGASLNSAGDINGDGYSDLIVGAYQYDNGSGKYGAAFVYLGSATGLETTPAWTTYGEQLNSYYGIGVDSAGDVNGDGYSDVIVGSSQFDDIHPDVGKAYLYLGSSSGLSITPDWTYTGSESSSQLGSAVSKAGDINGDGFSDVIIGEPNYGLDAEGRVFGFLGSSSGLAATADWQIAGLSPLESFGASLDTAGDINGDGYADIIVGAPLHDNGESYEGAVYVFNGTSLGINTTPSFQIESDLESSWMGFSVSTAGDVNNDGYSDVVFSAYEFDNGQINEGRGYVHYGSSLGLSITPDWQVESNVAQMRFGRGVSAAGDVNGDGFSDVLIGANGYSNPESNEGVAFLYYGNGGSNYAVAYKQLRADDVNMHKDGKPGSSNTFKIQATAEAFTGRTAAKLQYEVKPLGTAFDGTGLAQSSYWTDIGASGTTLTETVSGLTEDTSYHWRARLIYRDPIYQYSTPWFSIGTNAWTESDFKTNDLVTLTYIAGSGGNISGTNPQTINYGANGATVSALPNAGYQFVNWSDASTANPRTDTNVTSDITVTANFAPITYTLTYTAGSGGSISGTTSQSIAHGANGTTVTAIANSGYQFSAWSDGSTTNPRTDTNITANLALTANFVQIPATPTPTPNGIGNGGSDDTDSQTDTEDFNSQEEQAENEDEQLIFTSGETMLYDLRIRVVDTDGNLLENATVSISNIAKSKDTNKNGEAEFASLEGGEYEIKVEYNGKTVSKTIVLEGNESVIDIEIEIESSQGIAWYIYLLIIIIILIALYFVYKTLKKKDNENVN